MLCMSDQIDAVNDSAANINGFMGATNVVNALSNDTLNGAAVIPAQVTISNVVPATPINGGAVPVLNPSNGNVNVPAGTAAGTYTIQYRLSENLNPANFDTATITIVVIAPTIIANADNAGTINGYTGGTNIINAITNDRLNGSDIQLVNINITSVSTTTPAGYVSGNPVPVLNTATGNVDVPAGTSAGIYVIHYRICEKLNPSNCSEADITINVIAPIIDANNDFANAINGYVGANNVVNALTNDSLNGVTAQATLVNISVLSTTPPPTSTNGIVPVLNTATGNVDVPPGTSAGTYFIQYQICEKLNPTNCDQATIIIIVNAPPIVAEDDTITNANGLSGINNVLNAFTNNDTYNGVLLTDVSLINPTIISGATSINGGLVPVLDLATGFVSIPAGTPVGTYQIRYRICDKLNPTNCDDAIITIVVAVPTIVANDDAADNINGLTGASNVLNAYANDTLNGTTILQTNINSTLITAANSINGAAVPVLNILTGAVDVPAGTAAGVYSIVYKICDKLNPSNCDEAVIKITVAQPSIQLLKQGVFVDSNGDGYAQPGEQIRYSFVITNTGTLDLNNVVVTDPKANITGTPIAVLGVGQSNTTNYKGTYVLTQADINLGYVENQALVKAQPTSGSAIQDLSDSNDLTLIGPNDPTITPVPQHKELTLIKGGKLTGNGGVGSIINYSFTVKNTGNVALTNLVVTDPMLTATTIAVSPNVLAPGATGTATASYTVNIADVAKGVVINSALAIGDDPQGNPVTDISDSDDPTLTGDDDPTVVNLSLKPSIALIKTATFNDENKNGYAEVGETVTYRFSITNTGNIILVNVVVKDPKPGVTITGDPVILKQGETNSNNFVGTYVLTAADLEAGSVVNQAEVNAVSPDGQIAKDLSDGNSLLGDNPTVLPLDACKITVHNAFSPNGDGINEVFKIDGVECYPDVYVEIYDRWGVLVYDAHGYNNTSVVFTGISEGRATVNKQKGLPVGTYFYVITYKTYLNEPISLMGYLYFSR